MLGPQMWVLRLPGLSNLWHDPRQGQRRFCFLLGVEDIVYWARELGASAKGPSSTIRIPTGGFWYFLGAGLLLPQPDANCPKSRSRPSTRRLSRGHATLAARSVTMQAPRDWRVVGTPSPTMACARSGFGERILPRSDFTLCQHFTLIGSGLLWNIYFGVLALSAGLFRWPPHVAARQGRRKSPLIRKPCEWFIFLFRGSPLFIQFFFAYEAFVLLPREGHRDLRHHRPRHAG